MTRRTLSKNVLFLSWLLLASVLNVGGVAQAEYPDRPITVLCAFDPGSSSDLITRASGVGAEKVLGKHLVFENRAGGGGTVALALLVTAKPDGYTLAGAPNVSVVDTPL